MLSSGYQSHSHAVPRRDALEHDCSAKSITEIVLDPTDVMAYDSFCSYLIDFA
jgi:hypothetical protein